MVPTFERYDGKVPDLGLPESLFAPGDYKKRLKFDGLKNIRIESLCHWKQKDSKGIKKNAYIKEIQRKNDQILKVNDKTKLEKLEVYTDRFPCLNFRKQLWKIAIQIHLISKYIIESKLFEDFTITVIVANSLVMLREGSEVDPPPFFEIAEDIFLQLYTFEMVVKILG